MSGGMIVDFKMDATEIVLRLLKKQLEFDRAWRVLHVLPIDIPAKMCFDSLDLVADIIGIPEEEPENYDDDGGDDPYSRDWIWYEWRGVVSGKKTIDDFVDSLNRQNGLNAAVKRML